MTPTAMTARIGSLVALASVCLLAAPSPASAKPGTPACGANYLPFHEGQVFEYEWLAPEAISADGAGPRGPQADWPVNLKIAVMEIKGDKKKATIKLLETYRKRQINTVITCSEAGFRISPQSFFFTGEPGGGIGMTLSKFKQDQPGLPGPRDFRAGQEYTSYITANVTRKVSEGIEVPSVTNGKVEIDRTIAIGGKEKIETGLGEMRAFRISVELGGRAAVEPALDKWRELPTGAVTMWLVPGKGLVRVHNRFGHGWQIKEIVYAE